MKQKIVILVLCILSLVLIAWIASMVYYEAKTYKYGDMFEDAWKKNTMIDWVDTMKVLSFSEDSARIYYLQINKEWGFWKSGSRANILTFEKEIGEWKEENWEDWEWDDRLLWPYIYHSPIGVIYMILWAVLFSIFLVKTIIMVKVGGYSNELF